MVSEGVNPLIAIQMALTGNVDLWGEQLPQI